MRIVILALLAGCAGAEAMTLPKDATVVPRQDELGFHPGETMTFEVQLAGVLVGEAQLAVGEIGEVEGKRAIVVRSRAATAGAAALLKKISDEATSVIDAETGRPISVETAVDMNGKQITTKARFAGKQVDVEIKRGDATPTLTRINAKTEIMHDAHAAMAQVRGWRATTGATRTLWVLGGRRVWRVDVKLVGEETIGSQLGNRRALVFEGVSFRARRDLTLESNKPSRTFKVWLSHDADRVPLRVSAKTELGDIVMSLADYSRP
ncbi:MAG: DUF3108 domain-containing protein [Kofleriaceae bacterium]